jgi:cytoplasmic protein
MKLRFLRIYIFDSVSKKAFSTEFKEGINVITSSNIDGTDRGKSVLLRSLYHALGADAHYDEKWQEKNKIYILEFSLDEEIHYIYRSGSLFKMFDGNKNKVFTTIHRTELAEYIEDLFGFSMYLPQKTNEKLSIAPPVFTYLLSFVDQDKYNGTKFDSFKRLEQFSNIKPNVIYSHLGLYNKVVLCQ